MTTPWQRECAEGDLLGIAKELCEVIPAGSWVFLEGDLGAGKTTLAQVLLKEWGVVDKVTSPTFSIMNSYAIPKMAAKHVRTVVHLDLYRLKSARELHYLGLENTFDAKSIAIFEWAERIDDEEWEDFFATTGCLRPRQTFHIKIVPSHADPHKRSYTLT